MAPFFSVIIPHFNGTKNVVQTLRSLYHQTLSDFEVLVVDDCSSDSEFQKLKTLCDDLKAGLFRLGHNQGPAAARNLGLVHARGQYICFLDSDDLWEQQYLEIKKQEILHHGKPILVSTGYSFSGQRVLGRINHIQNFSRLMLFTNPIGCPSGVVIATDLARSARFREDLRLFEDYDFYLRVFTVENMFLSKSIYFYRMEGQNTTNRLVAQRSAKWVTRLHSNDSRVVWSFLRFTNSLFVTWKYRAVRPSVSLLILNPFIWIRLMQKLLDFFLFRMVRSRLQERLKVCLNP